MVLLCGDMILLSMERMCVRNGWPVDLAEEGEDQGSTYLRTRRDQLRVKPGIETRCPTLHDQDVEHVLRKILIMP